VYILGSTIPRDNSSVYDAALSTTKSKAALQLFVILLAI